MRFSHRFPRRISADALQTNSSSSHSIRLLSRKTARRFFAGGNKTSGKISHARSIFPPANSRHVCLDDLQVQLAVCACVPLELSFEN